MYGSYGGIVRGARPRVRAGVRAEKVGEVRAAKAVLKEDFDEELPGKVVQVSTIKQEFKGRVAGTSRYWIKLETESGVVYVNKAHIVSVSPA